MMAEIAARWIRDGRADTLLRLQRKLLNGRQAMVSEHLGEHILGQHPNALSVWLGVPPHWEVDSLVRTLRQRHIAVASPDPFTVRGVARARGVRLCVGAECSDDEMREALTNMHEIFGQYPSIHEF